MRELPILFSGEMVRAILAGRKTETRRLLKPQPQDHHWEGLRGHRHEVRLVATSTGLSARCSHWLRQEEDKGSVQWVGSPYGTAGDHLWGRETLRRSESGAWAYAADNATVVAPRSDTRRVGAMLSWAHHKTGNICVSIHMPRFASRLTLEVTGVFVQRLQDITGDECRAEGCSGGHDSIPGYPFSATPREHYSALWDRLNAAPGRDWDSNPWVWVVKFKRVEGAR